LPGTPGFRVDEVAPSALVPVRHAAQDGAAEPDQRVDLVVGQVVHHGRQPVQPAPIRPPGDRARQADQALALSDAERGGLAQLRQDLVDDQERPRTWVAVDRRPELHHVERGIDMAAARLAESVEVGMPQPPHLVAQGLLADHAEQSQRVIAQPGQDEGVALRAVGPHGLELQHGLGHVDHEVVAALDRLPVPAGDRAQQVGVDHVQPPVLEPHGHVVLRTVIAVDRGARQAQDRRLRHRDGARFGPVVVEQEQPARRAQEQTAGIECQRGRRHQRQLLPAPGAALAEIVAREPHDVTAAGDTGDMIALRRWTDDPLDPARHVHAPLERHLAVRHGDDVEPRVARGNQEIRDRGTARSWHQRDRGDVHRVPLADPLVARQAVEHRQYLLAAAGVPGVEVNAGPPVAPVPVQDDLEHAVVAPDQQPPLRWLAKRGTVVDMMDRANLAVAAILALLHLPAVAGRQLDAHHGAGLRSDPQRGTAGLPAVAARPRLVVELGDAELLRLETELVQQANRLGERIARAKLLGALPRTRVARLAGAVVHRTTRAR
jgi:hypothetical protein